MMDFSPFIDFDKSHIDHMDLNEFSDVTRFQCLFDNPEYRKYTLVDGNPVMVFCFREYWQGNYEAFILASTSMTLKHGKIFKEMIERAAVEMSIKRIHTVSVACDKLDKWHEYLGFTPEGTHKKLMFNQDYRTWARLWD